MSQNHMRKTKFEYHLHRDTELFFFSSDLACRLHKVKINMVLELNPGGHRILFSSVRMCGHLPSKVALYSLGMTQTISVQYHVFMYSAAKFIPIFAKKSLKDSAITLSSETIVSLIKSSLTLGDLHFRPEMAFIKDQLF
jgi:hypothetical protein